ncbi:MAG: type II secretion system protein [Planctomycetota bacterium]|jgi:prepilin-type N-terminal cleavage/methylation domain-containing protein/prepilin-type processing-associated H-X9-DG protein
MRGKAFTLVELLIVIAVIAVLMSVLVSVLRTAREQGRAAVCGLNLNQLSLALITYAQENETFPYGFDDLTNITISPPGGYVGSASRDLLGWWWFHFLADICGDDYDKGTVYWCPSRCIQDTGLKANILCGNYGVNRAICKNAQGTPDCEFIGKPPSLYEIRRPVETLLIIDSGYNLASWSGATNASVQPFENTRREGSFYIPGLQINQDRLIFPGQESDARYGRHLNKRVNVGFADGHIDRLNADDLLVEDVNGNYSNLSPLWLPK